jgi:hypothetical protein
MARTNASNPFQLKDPKEAAREAESQVHVFGNGVVCNTDTRGFATPGNKSPAELVVHTSEGFIPLWAFDMTLRWRFQERSFLQFEDPWAARGAVMDLFGEALLGWGDAAPVKFAERDDAWDFEIVMRDTDQCNANGCVLASAFFPDPGRHELAIFPRMLVQSKKEQIDTLVHETGHIFGLRHFFAKVSEGAWPSEIFGIHKPFTIMNYGHQSELTADDKADLRNLYQTAWSGELTHINGTKLRFVKPFSALGEAVESMTPAGRVMGAEVAAPAMAAVRYARAAVGKGRGA